jgi:D-serine deaminase-like pyridoxal phosphate-dependent protein
MAHTPGPWVGFSDQGKCIAIMPAMRGGDVCTFEKPPSADDARLIVAAPDLLSAAKEVMAAIEEYGGSIVPHLIDTDMNAGQRLRVAIAKAEAA